MSIGMHNNVLFFLFLCCQHVEISKVRTYQQGRQESKISSLGGAKDSLFFQPANRLAATRGRSSTRQLEEDATECK